MPRFPNTALTPPLISFGLSSLHRSQSFVQKLLSVAMSRLSADLTNVAGRWFCLRLPTAAWDSPYWLAMARFDSPAIKAWSIAFLASILQMLLVFPPITFSRPWMPLLY